MEEINNTEEEFRLNQDKKENGVQVFTERYSESAINRLKDLVVKYTIWENENFMPYSLMENS